MRLAHFLLLACSLPLAAHSLAVPHPFIHLIEFVDTAAAIGEMFALVRDALAVSITDRGAPVPHEGLQPRSAPDACRQLENILANLDLSGAHPIRARPPGLTGRTSAPQA
jgi:hypothetical protein